MNWIKINNSSDLPRNENCEPFLSLWKGRICLTQWDKDLNQFWLVYEPLDYEDSSWLIPNERENRFDYWMPLPKYPDNYMVLI